VTLGICDPRYDPPTRYCLRSTPCCHTSSPHASQSVTPARFFRSCVRTRGSYSDLRTRGRALSSFTRRSTPQHAAARRSTQQHAAARGSSWQLVAAAARPQAAFTAHPFTPSPLPRATIRHPVRRPRATIPSGQSATTTGTTRVRVSATCERVPCINGTCVSVTRRHHNNMCMRIHPHGELHQSRPSPPSG